jgi:prophage regulatory protein
MPEIPEITRFPQLLLRKEQVLAVTGLTNSALYREIEAGRFPRPVQITPGAVAWPASEVEAWANSRPRADRKPHSRRKAGAA